MKFITLSGVDGSGKSTQLALLKESFEKNGEKVAVFNAVEFSLANRIARAFKNEKTFKPGKDKAVTKASWIAIILREKFLFLDFLRFRFLRRKLERQGYTVLLSDRSFYDSLINISYLSQMSFPRRRESTLFRFWIPAFAGMTRLSLRCLEQLLLKPDIAFFLDIDPESVMRRERAPEQGIEYLREKRALFQEKAPTWSLVLINADQPKKSVFSDIRSALDKFPQAR